jgi:TolA-binding protein
MTVRHIPLEDIMKTIVSAIVALSVVAGFAAQASAAAMHGKQKTTVESLDSESRGGHLK